MTTLLSARRDIALCCMSRMCPVRDTCYRSSTVRAIAVSEPQNWMEATPLLDRPCEEWRAVDGDDIEITPPLPELRRIKVKSVRVEELPPFVLEDEPTGEALYITTDQVDEYRAAGWTVEPVIGHHGKAGYWAATREV